jgi:hypothetical protein
VLNGVLLLLMINILAANYLGYFFGGGGHESHEPGKDIATGKHQDPNSELCCTVQYRSVKKC